MTPQLNKETNLTQVSQQDSKEIYTIYLYLNKLQVSICNLYVIHNRYFTIFTLNQNPF